MVRNCCYRLQMSLFDNFGVVTRTRFPCAENLLAAFIKHLRGFDPVIRLYLSKSHSVVSSHSLSLSRRSRIVQSHTNLPTDVKLHCPNLP